MINQVRDIGEHIFYMLFSNRENYPITNFNSKSLYYNCFTFINVYVQSIYLYNDKRIENIVH